MAPEILRYEKYDAKADLWSVGAVLFEMSVGKPPFRAQNHVDLLRKIERGEDKIKFPDEKRQEEGTDKVPTKVAPDVKALIRALLKRNPTERMNFDDFFREATAVATSGTASNLKSAEAVSAAYTKAAAASASSSTSRQPSRSPSTHSPAEFLVTAATASYSQPAVVPPPAPAAVLPSPRIPSYIDQEPPPFARRSTPTSSIPTAPSRVPSYPKFMAEPDVKVRDFVTAPDGGRRGR